MKFSLSSLTDSIFTLIVTFILSFLTLNYFFSRSLAIVFSGILSLLFSILTFKVINDKKIKFRLSKKESEDLNKIISQLNLSTPLEQLSLFDKALKKDGYSLENKNSFLYLPEKKIAIFLNFKFDSTTKTDIVKAFNLVNKADKIYILAENFSKEIEDFASRFDGRINLISANKIYHFLVKTEVFPKTKIELKTSKKVKFSDLIVLLDKKKAKTHLGLGVIFLTLSYFVPIKLYYIIFGCSFLILSLFCRLFGREPLNNN